MARTPEQRDADTALADAVQRCAEAYGWVGSGATLADFVVVLESTRYGEDPDVFEEFHSVLYRDGQTRRTVAVGLLDVGKDLVMRDLADSAIPGAPGDDVEYGDDSGY